MNTDIFKLMEKDKFAAYVGIKLVEAAPGHAIAQMNVTEDHLNGVNLVQGGAIFTLADFTFAAAANAKGLVSLSINANISYIKSPKGRIITAEASEVSSSRKICVYNVDIFDEDKELVAKFNGMGYIKG